MSKEKKLARLRERENGLMRIAEITDERIVFNNGNYICFAHEPDCCEDNYADFEYLLDECCLFTTLFDENIIFVQTNLLKLLLPTFLLEEKYGLFEEK